LAEIERLWDAPAKSSDADKLDILTLLVQHYESIHYPIADPDPHPLRMSESEEDLWAVQIPKAEWIESAENFDQVIVAASGEMAMMRTIDPVSFVRLKRLIAVDADRDPMKRPKDILQADIVEKLIKDFLPQWHSKMT